MRGSRTEPGVWREQTSLRGWSKGRVKSCLEGLQKTQPAGHGLHFLPPALPGLSQVQHPHGGERNLAACAQKRRGCCSAQESLSQSCYPMNEYKPAMSTGLSVLASPTRGGSEIRGSKIPSSTCKKDRNKTALLPGAEEHTPVPTMSARALWGGGCLRVSQSSRSTGTTQGHGEKL